MKKSCAHQLHSLRPGSTVRSMFGMVTLGIIGVPALAASASHQANRLKGAGL
jgi:hypothetical protein